MSDRRTERQRRPRLSAEERARLLEEIAQVEAAAQARQTARRPPPDLAAERELRTALTERIDAPLPRVIDLWSDLQPMSVDPRVLERNLVITAARTDPAHAAFDVLRTRLVQALGDNGWTRVAITSPTPGCGKSFTAINLAITLSRYQTTRTVLCDLDLRAPGLAGYLGVTDARGTGDYLRGQIASEEWLRTIGKNRLNIGRHLAIGLNGRREDYAAELLQSPQTADILDRMEAELSPDVVLFDLPPALAQDDVTAFRDRYDCVLLVVGGGTTRAAEVREAIRRIGEDKPVVGIVLNKAQIDGDIA
ncbi:CpsD/CapB family tyrosine-protein kinase [Wenxinia marina]|uniref:ATPase involved in chromosome partitioning n=1 Tax=Wenxinia marina DSM 24838 TaxID=1123501 RepID=A0A0D0PHN9_9RHOB|nr:CpsD/CapB family tyrosine-protein kinase [Wenxinia marina]KIQ70906.1 ATPase involved in chromosome partitioning [Wenxinia marina DSM 24838]